jgi:hypothetical protein
MCAELVVTIYISEKSTTHPNTTAAKSRTEERIQDKLT